MKFKFNPEIDVSSLIAVLSAGIAVLTIFVTQRVDDRRRDDRIEANEREVSNLGLTLKEHTRALQELSVTNQKLATTMEFFLERVKVTK